MKLLLTLLLASLLPVAQAARRVGEAQVRADANGQPCFTISEREEKRSGTPDFQSITVSQGQRILWRMAMPRERTFPVTFGMCIPYGGRVPALPQTPAAPLASGIVYAVQIETRLGERASLPLRYAGKFILEGRQNGSMRVNQVSMDER
jgi:hypothetical protein